MGRYSKLSSLLIILTMMMLCPQLSRASDRETVVFWDGDFGYSWSANNKVKLADCESKGDVVIPSSVVYGGKTYPVETIATHCFDGREGIKNITIPNSVHWIDNNAFDNCTDLTKVTFEDGADSIQIGYSQGYFFDDQIFYGCSNLYEVYLGRTVVIRDDSEDAPCEDMSTLTVLTVGPYVKKIPAKLFYNTGLKTIDFSNATRLETIGDYALAHSGIIYVVDLSKCTNLTSIGEYAFAKISMTEITLPGSITSLGKYCFKQGTRTADCTVDLSRCSKLRSIPESAFEGEDEGGRVQAVSLPEGLTTISASAFRYNRITKLTIPSTVTYIGDNAFERSTDSGVSVQPWGIKVLTLPGTEASESTKILNVDDENFEWVVTLDLDRNITGINGEKVFPSAQDVTIGSHVNFLQDGAFTGSKDLKSVTVAWNTKDVMDNLFTNGKAYSTYFPSKTVTLNVPACTEPFYKNADVWKGFSVTSDGMNSYSRKLSSKWGTLIVPFDVTSNSDIQYYEFNEFYPGDEELIVSPVENVTANTPCFFKRTSNSVSELNVSGDYKEPEAMEPELILSEHEGGDMKLYGSYYYGDSSIDDSECYYLAKDQLWWAEETFALPQHRACLKFSSSNEAKAIKLVASDELTNGIVDAASKDSEMEETAIYNIAGQVVSKNTKGIVIKNGKKYINR